MMKKGSDSTTPFFRENIVKLKQLLKSGQLPMRLSKNMTPRKSMITFYSNTEPDMEKNWQDIPVMTEENIHLFPKEYQDFFAQLQHEGVTGIFPKKKKTQVAESRAKYLTQLQQFVLAALETKPGATLREILEITLPKLPREVAPAYLTDLVQCAEAMLKEQEVIA